MSEPTKVKESAHTPGPWHVDGGYRMEIRAGAISIADIRWNGHNEIHGEANVRRIVAAVNACEGMDDPATEISEMRECVRLLGEEQNAAADRDHLRERVAELVKALEDIAANSSEDNEWDAVDKLHANEATARNILAKERP